MVTSMVRKFSLINADNATWDFTDPAEKIFASNPAGLGLSLSAETIRLGDKLKVTESKYEFVNKTFDVLFYGDTLREMYADYNRFVDFITVGDISLLYEIPSQDVKYRIKVLVSELTKTEVKDNGYMTCGLSLTPLSFWEDNEKRVIEISSSSAVADGKHYPLQRPYFYGESGFGDVEINITGNMETPFEITIDGETTDPQYSLFGNNNTPVGVGGFNGTFGYVYVNSDEIDEEIILKNTSDVELAHPYNYQDLRIGDNETTKVTFFNLKKGYNRLSFNLGGTFEGSIKIEWRNRYISV